MTDQFCLKWNNYQASLTNAFKSLLENEDFVDVTLSAGGKTLRAHKVVLSACSSYFKQLLRGISSWQHPILFLRDVPFVDLYTILEFIYMGEVNVAQSDLTSFLKTAEMLQIKGLAENAGNWNPENSDPDNDSGSDSLSSNLSSSNSISTPVPSHPSEISRSAVKRRRLSSETPGGKILNDSIASNNTDSTSNVSHQSATSKSEDDLELKEELNDDDLDDDNNLLVDESVDTDADADTELLLSNGDRRLSSNSSGGDKSISEGVQGIMMGPNHKKCHACGIVMLKKNFARHLRDMHTEPKPRSLCPLCQKSYKTSDWLKDHIRRGHGYTKELTDQLMATLKSTPIKATPTKATLSESPIKDKIPPLLSLENVLEKSQKDDSKGVSKDSKMTMIDLQQQPMTILNSLNIIKQETNIST